MGKKQTNYLKEMSWTEFVERKKETNLAILPAGAFEVYGPHLPLGADTIISVEIAERVSKDVNSIIGPILEVGDSASLDTFPGTITIKPENFRGYLTDVVDSLKKWGFKDFLFINPHIGNVSLIDQIATEMERDEDIRCAQIDYWRFIQAHDKGIIESGQLAHGHASEAGTSIFLHTHPELVDSEKAVNEPPKFHDAFPDVIQYQSYDQFSDSGTMGDATLGTEEKGKELVDRSVNRIISFLTESWGYNEGGR